MDGFGGLVSVLISVFGGSRKGVTRLREKRKRPSSEGLFCFEPWLMADGLNRPPEALSDQLSSHLLKLPALP
jgi:hypothetical protein